jgi:hypothetical protein
MDEKIAAKFEKLRTEINKISRLFADRGVDSPGSHWSRFCASCVLAKFCTINERRNQCLGNATSSLDLCKSEIKEYDLDSNVLNDVDSALQSLISTINEVVAHAQQASSEARLSR